MSYLQNMHAGLAKIRGGIAGSWGEFYDVRRMDGNTNVSISSNQPVIPNYNARIVRSTSKKIIEGEFFELVVFETVADDTLLEKMDELTEHDTGVTYVLAQQRKTRAPVFVRAEATVTITRPKPTSLAATQQPTSGAVYTGGVGQWSGIATQNEKVLTLTNGLYNFTDAQGSTPAQVLCGLSTNARFSEGNTLGVPVEQYRDQFVCYLPLLPGEMLNELDLISFGAANRYQIGKIMSTDLIGLSGYVLFLVKLGF